jgi:hypothetical protein
MVSEWLPYLGTAARLRSIRKMRTRDFSPLGLRFCGVTLRSTAPCTSFPSEDARMKITNEIARIHVANLKESERVSITQFGRSDDEIVRIS